MSTLRLSTIQNLAGVEVYTAKAWVNFNGTGTVAIRGSGNVSSITDNGTGDYTVNFTVAMADANFSAAATAINMGAGNRLYADQNQDPMTASSWRVGTWNENGSLVDASFVHVITFR